MLRGWIVACLVVSATQAHAADVEIFGGLSFWFPRFDTSYDASYTPSRVVSINQIFTDPDARSSASQRLTLQGETGPGFGWGVNVFPHPVLGAQFLFDRGAVDVVGENPSHVVDLTYDTIAFPNPDPIVATTTHRFTPNDTEGRLEETTLSFNLAARFGSGGVVTGMVSGFCFGTYSQLMVWSFSAIEKTLFGKGVCTYMVSPITRGPPSCPRNTPVEKVQATCRSLTFLLLI